MGLYIVGLVSCPECGQEVSDRANTCPHCGFPLEEKISEPVDEHNTVGDAYERVPNPAHKIPPDTSKSPGLAVVLSLLVSGLGQMYLGQVKKGLAILIGGMFLSAITFMVLSPVIWIVAAVDAYHIASKLTAGRSVDEWEWF